MNQKVLKKQAILAVNAADGNWQETAKRLNVPLSTAYRWISKGEIFDKIRGSPHPKLTEEHDDFLIVEIEKNPRLSLVKLAELLLTTFNLQVSPSTVWRRLKKLSFTIKKVRFESERANFLGNRIKRRAFVEKISGIFKNLNY